MTEYVADVIAVIEDLAVQRVGFVGYSMGAQVGYALAAARADLISSLVGLGVTWEAAPDPDEDTALVSQVRTQGMAALVALVEADEDLALPRWLRDQFLNTDAEQFALSIEALKDWTGWSNYKRIECPALLIAGEAEDPSHLNAAAAAEMPRGQAVWLPGLGHVGAFLAARDQCQLIAPHLQASMAIGSGDWP
jgi:pimeloyl-ACP methyl ester carboxylesterase